MLIWFCYDADDDDDVEMPPAKKVCSFFGDLFSPTVAEADELRSYLVSTNTTDSDILQFWKNQSTVWPKLSTVARVILAIPATETSSERVFSLAGRTLEDRRTTLNVESVDDLLFIHGLRSSKVEK